MLAREGRVGEDAPRRTRSARRGATALAAALLACLGLSGGSASAATAIAATATVQFSGQVATVAGCTPASSPSATIDWGDGTASSAATITVSGTQLAIGGAHTYIKQGVYDGSVSGAYLCDGDHVPLSATFTAQVAAATAAPAATISATEGSPFSGQVATAAIGCTPASSPTATIAWGDGSASSTANVAVSGSEFVISAAHTYAEEGSFTGAVSGSYLCGGEQIPIGPTFTAHVADAALRAGAATIAAPAAGRRFAGTVATFSDADPGAAPSDYRVALTWGDGTASPAMVTGAGGRFTVSGTHTYTAAGDHHIQVGIRDLGGAAATATDAVTVRPPVGVKLAVSAPRTIGDGTALLSIRLPGRGRLTVTQASRGRIYLEALRMRVNGAGPSSVILQSTSAAARLERQGDHLRLTAHLTFTAAGGLTINRWIPIVMDYVTCSAGMVFHYTGSEQACLVPGSGTSHMHLILDGAAGGNGPGPCGPFPDTAGTGGRGAAVDATSVPVKTGMLYIEVGGVGGDGSHNCIVESGSAGAGGWNGGGAGALGSGLLGSGGGGGATDVRTVSCASICDQGGGFGVLFSLATRLVVASGGGGGGSGGGAGCQQCSTTGGNGGWGNTAGGTDGDGSAGSAATISGTQGIVGVGGGGGTSNAAGDGGVSDAECGQSYDPPPCTYGGPGHIGVGGVGGEDPFYSRSVQPFVEGFGGGGGGGGYWGGGGGDGGLVSQGNTVGAGGGGGGGSSFGPPRSYFSAAYDPAMVRIVSMT